MSDICTLKGIGEKTAKQFGKLGISTIEDLLEYYPRDYEEYKEPTPIGQVTEDTGEPVSVLGRISGSVSARRARGLVLVSASVTDGTGTLTVTWFNAPFMKNNLISGKTYIFRGRPKVSGRSISSFSRNCSLRRITKSRWESFCRFTG